MFFDMSHPYDAELRNEEKPSQPNSACVFWKDLYAGLLGPSFETASEIEMLKQIGADLVGMSTIMEVISARQLGMRVLAVSFISNMAAGVTAALVNNEEVQVAASAAEATYAALTRQYY